MAAADRGIALTLPGISFDNSVKPHPAVIPTMPALPEIYKSSSVKATRSPLKFSEKTIFLQMYYASALEFATMYNARIINNLNHLRLNSRYRPWANLLLRPERDMMGVGQDPRGNYISIVLRVNEHLAVVLCNNQTVYKGLKAQTGTAESHPFNLDDYMIDSNITFMPNSPRGMEIVFRQFYHEIDVNRFVTNQLNDDEVELFGE